MSNFDDINIFGNTSLADVFKQIHKKNKDTDKQINEFIDALKPLASSNAGSAVMLMPTVKDLIDVNVRNNEQLIKMAGIVQRASTSTASDTSFINMDEINILIEEQRAVLVEGDKLLEQTEVIQHKLENKQ